MEEVTENYARLQRSKKNEGKMTPLKKYRKKKKKSVTNSKEIEIQELLDKKIKNNYFKPNQKAVRAHRWTL